MKTALGFLLGMALLGGCADPTVPTITAGKTENNEASNTLNPRTSTQPSPSYTAAMEKIETPIELPTSDLLGLTEAEVMKRQGLERLNPEPDKANKKWYSDGIIEFPALGGYVWSRCHILTFKDDKVVKHEMVDRPTACVEVQPPGP